MLAAASYERATDRTRARLAAASFFERTNLSRALIVCRERRNSSLLLTTDILIYNQRKWHICYLSSVLLHFASLLASPARSLYYYTSNQSIHFSLFT